MLQGQRGMVGYLPLSDFSHQPTDKVRCNTGCDPTGVIIFIRDGGVVIFRFHQAAQRVIDERRTTVNPVTAALGHFFVSLRRLKVPAPTVKPKSPRIYRGHILPQLETLLKLAGVLQFHLMNWSGGRCQQGWLHELWQQADALPDEERSRLEGGI